MVCMLPRSFPRTEIHQQSWRAPLLYLTGSSATASLPLPFVPTEQPPKPPSLSHGALPPALHPGPTAGVASGRAGAGVVGSGAATRSQPRPGGQRRVAPGAAQHSPRPACSRSRPIPWCASLCGPPAARLARRGCERMSVMHRGGVYENLKNFHSN
jgi:hypothetical protein